MGIVNQALAGLASLTNKFWQFGDGYTAPGHVVLDSVTGLPLDYTSPASVKQPASTLYTSTRSSDGDFATIDLADYDHLEFDCATTGSGVTFVITPSISFDGGANYKAEQTMVVAYDDPSARGAVGIVDRTGHFAINGRGGIVKFTMASLAGTGSPTVTLSGRAVRNPMSYLRDYDNRMVQQPYAPQWADVSEPVQVDLTNANAVSGNGYQIAAGAGATSNLANALANITLSGVATTTAVTVSILAGATVIWKVNLPAGIFDKHYSFPRLLTTTRGGSLNIKLSGDPTGAISMSCQPFRVRK